MQFVTDFYSVMEDVMKEFDVYKFEVVADRFMIASGVLRKNGDAHAINICAMALKMERASHIVVRPDKKPATIALKAGIHTGITQKKMH